LKGKGVKKGGGVSVSKRRKEEGTLYEKGREGKDVGEAVKKEFRKERHLGG